MNNVVAYVIIAVLSACLVQQCSDKNKALENLGFSVLQKDSIRSENTRKGDLVTLQSQIILEQDKKLIAAADKIKHLETLSAQVVIETQVEVPVYIPLEYHDTTYVVDSVPIYKQTVAFQNQYVSLGLHILDQSHAFLDSLRLFNETTVQLGTNKHFFKADSHEVLVKHSNPYFKTVGMENLVFRESPKWWQRGVVKFGAGLLAGVMIAK